MECRIQCRSACHAVCLDLIQLFFLIFVASYFDDGHSLILFAVCAGPSWHSPLISARAFYLSLFRLFPSRLPLVYGVRARRERRCRPTWLLATRLVPYGMHPLKGARVGEAAVPGHGWPLSRMMSMPFEMPMAETFASRAFGYRVDEAGAGHVIRREPMGCRLPSPIPTRMVDHPPFQIR